MAVLPTRFRTYGLTLHPHTTRVRRVTHPPRYDRGGRRRDQEAWPGTGTGWNSPTTGDAPSKATHTSVAGVVALPLCRMRTTAALASTAAQT